MRGPQIHPEVQAALDAGRPLVALESTIISHGLPRPDNLRVARELEQTVRDEGAVPATVAVMAGQVRIGVDPEGLRAIATRDDVTKVSARDLPAVVAHRGYGATTVAASAHLAARAGIRIFATGGLGGVHREARETWDESADLITLARTPIAVVCSGVKSTLDVAATLERLETLGVTVVGYRTTAFPGFYLSDSGCILDWRVDSSEQVAEVLRARDALGLAGAVVIANPLPTDQQLDPTLHDHVVRDALSAAAATGVRGKAVTPYVLDRVHRDTQGASLAANIRLVLRNAELAAAIAVAVAANRPTIRT